MQEWNGQKVVVKRNKSTKEFHEFLMIYAYSLISVLLASPSVPPTLYEIAKNEGREMRDRLSKIGISTPTLISISDNGLVEEYVEGGDLYRALVLGGDVSLALEAGRLTGRLHKAGYAFVDNKAQNFLVRGDSVIRTDLGFMRKGSSQYARCMDVGSFLASVMDLNRYAEIERAFYEGYISESGSKFQRLSLIVRNVLSVGFSSDNKTTLRNMLLYSLNLLEI